MDSSKTTKTSTNALVYLRVSTEEQVENYSLQTQEASCRQEAQRRGLNIARIFREEGKSAKTIKGRPALLDLLELCRKRRQHISVVLVHHLDRLSRTTYDYLVIKSTLASYKIGIISVHEPTGTDPMENFVETLFASIAQLDNELRAQRARQGLEARFMAGLPNGLVGVGYLNQNGNAIEDTQSFEQIKAAWDELQLGEISVRALVRKLNALGVRTRNGDPLRLQTLLGVFRNKFYAGAIVSKKRGQEVHGQHRAMISEETFYRVQDILDRRSRKFNRGHARRAIHPDFPLRQLVRCGHCGKGLTGSWNKGRLKRYAHYSCTGHCSEIRYIRVKLIHDAALDLLKQLNLKKRTIKDISHFLRVTYAERTLTVQQRQAQLTSDIEHLTELRHDLIDKHFSGIHSKEVFKEQSKILDEKMKAATSAKDVAATTRYNLDEILRFFQEKFTDLAATFETATVEQKRSLIRALFPAKLVWSRFKYKNPKLSQWYQLMKDAEKSPKLVEKLGGASYEQTLHWIDQLRREFYGMPS